MADKLDIKAFLDKDEEHAPHLARHAPERPRHEGDVHEQGRRIERHRAGFEGVAQREAGGNRACEHQRERHSLSNSSAISASTSASNRKKPLLIFSTPR